MSALKTISIEHYRGFFDRQDIHPAVPNGEEGSGLTVLVGPNNCGKTTVVSGLRLLLAPTQVDAEERHDDFALRISITNDENETKWITNSDLGPLIQLQGNTGAWPRRDSFRIVPSRRTWSPHTGQQPTSVDAYWANTLQERRGGDDSWLVARMATLSATDKASFDVLLKELIPQISKWRPDLFRGQSLVLYETHAGTKHASDLFGDGMASLFRVALALFDSRPDGCVIVIDEPELSLHPQAQKKLASVLARFSGDRQIIITTHSPYFVRWADMASGANIYRLTQNAKGISIGRLNAQTVKDVSKLIADWQKPSLLDAVAREVFFSDDVLFLEGQEDVGLLKHYSESRGLYSLPAFGYGAGGAGNIIFFLRMARDLNIPAAAIYDGDHVCEKKKAEGEIPNALIELLPTDDIRDKPDRDQEGRELDSIRKIGLFDRHGVIKQQYEAYLTELVKKIEAYFASARDRANLKSSAKISC